MYFCSYISWDIIFQYVYDTRAFLMLSVLFHKNIRFGKVMVCVSDKEKVVTMLDLWVSLVGS